MKTTIYTDSVIDYIDNNRNDLVDYLKDSDREATDEEIQKLAYSEIEFEANELLNMFKHYDKQHRHSVLVVGTFGLWYGKAQGGTIYKGLDALTDLYEDVNTFYFNRKNGTLRLEAIHHDGTNNFAIYELTDKGEQYLLEHEYELDRKTLHQRLRINGRSKAIKQGDFAEHWGW